MTLQIGAMIVGLLLVSGASLWGLNGLRQDYGSALAGYQELRQVYEVGSHLATAKTLLASPDADRAVALREVQTAAERFELFSRLSGPEPGSIPPDGRGEAETAIHDELRDAVRQLQTPASERADANLLAADARAVGRVLAQIGTLAARIGSGIRLSERAAQQQRHATMLAMGVVCAVVVAGAVLLGLMQYRGVMLPLRRLGHGVRNIAAGQFAERLEESGHDEFAMLARDFNRMAEELDGFYHQLEQKVASKSRELVRSERLASVGYLAAGVAHEINNPLGVIAGYAEYSLGQLGQNGAPPDSEQLRAAMQIICDEAFRCKDITSRLLSLARPGEVERRRIRLPELVQQVVSIVGGLKEYRDRKLLVQTGPGDEHDVMAVEAEVKQVVLNLMINALEAVPPASGEVRVDIARREQLVELSVSDNGRGMSAQTLERVFEPFFTDKRGPRQHGTGLGLSISHAIVTDHGGRIRAESQGLGFGSRFVVELPAAPPQGVA